jgi:hypothetical protein
VMEHPPPPAVTTRRDVYVLCPDLASFRATHSRPLQGVWHTVNNDFGSYKRKQKQQLKKKRSREDEADVTVTDEEAYVHTRELALRRYDAATRTASSASAPSLPGSSASASATSAVPAAVQAAPSAVPAASAEAWSHSAIEESFGEDCFPWAYWASQDSIAEHRLTGYYLTDRQWLNRVVKLIKTLGDRSQLDSWNECALDHRPFDDRHIVEAGRTAALSSRPDAVELMQRQVAASLKQLHHHINSKLEARHHSTSLAHTASPSVSQSESSSHAPVALEGASASSAAVSRADEDEEVVFVDRVARCTGPAVERPHSQQPRVTELRHQSPATSSSSASPASHCPNHVDSIRRVPFDNAEFVHPLHRSRRWRLTYRGKGTFAQVYVGKPSQHDSGSADIAIKFALDPSSQDIDRELRHEAEMMARVARVSPNAACQLVFQPRPGDDVITLASGAQQPVFIVMELVDCDFGELERSGRLSRCAMLEGFLLSFLALQDVHRSGVLHRDLKLNNLAFCIDHNDVDSRSDTCSRDVRLSVRILDFGEALPLRSGDLGPTSYGQCRSEYASIARHNGEEQGFKDDIEMLLYAFLDKLMTGGLPWKQGGQRLDRSEMRRRKVGFRRSTKGEPSELILVNMLSTLDAIHARGDPPYPVLEAALTRAWQHEWREHHSRGAKRPKRLYDCIELQGKKMT